MVANQPGACACVSRCSSSSCRDQFFFSIRTRSRRADRGPGQRMRARRCMWRCGRELWLGRIAQGVRRAHKLHHRSIAAGCPAAYAHRRPRSISSSRPQRRAPRAHRLSSPPRAATRPARAVSLLTPSRRQQTSEDDVRNQHAHKKGRAREPTHPSSAPAVSDAPRPVPRVARRRVRCVWRRPIRCDDARAVLTCRRRRLSLRRDCKRARGRSRCWGRSVRESTHKADPPPAASPPPRPRPRHPQCPARGQRSRCR